MDAMMSRQTEVRAGTAHGATPVSADTDLGDHARILLQRATALLDEAGHMLLVVSYRRAVGVRLVAWDADFCAHDLGGLFASTIAQAVEPAAVTFLALLARRWPPNAIPEEFGVVIDGTGIVYSPTHPSPLADGWIAAHIDGAGRCVSVLNPSPTGPWSLIGLAPDWARSH